MPSSGNYSKKINTQSPGLIIILLDQSDSMRDPASSDPGSKKKAEIAADAVNRVIYAIVRRSSRGGTEVVKRCYIGVIGYGEVTGPVIGGWTTDLNNRADLKIGADGLKQYVQPVHNNGTPMYDAFAAAFPLASDWVKNNPDSFPPIVINITDGKPNDLFTDPKDGSRTRTQAQKILELGTSDGKLLLFNIHIGSKSTQEAVLPTLAEVKSLNEQYAEFLFEISSVIPETLRKSASDAGFTPGENARGMAFNAADKLVQFLDWGSSTVLR